MPENAEDVTVDWPWAFAVIQGVGTCGFQIPPNTRFEDVHELTVTRVRIAQPTPDGKIDWLPWVPYILGPKGLVDQDELIHLYPTSYSLLTRANAEGEKGFKRMWGLLRIVEATGQMPKSLTNGNLRLRP